MTVVAAPQPSQDWIQTSCCAMLSPADVLAQFKPMSWPVSTHLLAGCLLLYDFMQRVDCIVQSEGGLTEPGPMCWQVRHNHPVAEDKQASKLTWPKAAAAPADETHVTRYATCHGEHTAAGLCNTDTISQWP
jgi:hypothetical protein